MPDQTLASAVTSDPKTFDIRSLIEGASTVTHAVEICFKPQLVGQIESLAAQIERIDATGPRRVANPARDGLVRQRDDLIDEALAATHRFVLRGLRNGEREKILKALGDDADTVVVDKWTRLDYACWAAQVTEVDGLPATVTEADMRDLHETLGNYFILTIASTGNAAHYAAGGVTIPFSSRSSEPSPQ